MLSAFKNFFITFLVAALVFGCAGYFATQFLTDTITGIFDSESDELNSILNPTPDSSQTPTDTQPPDLTDPDDAPIAIPGNSFNMLFIVTDYQPDIFNDYFPSKETLEQMQTNPSSAQTGILGATYRHPRAVATVLLRADKERCEFTYTVFPAITRVSTSSGEHLLGDLYDLYGTDYILNTVSALTGITIDYHLVVNITELNQVVEYMGGFPFYFTDNLYYNGITATSKKPSTQEDGLLPLLYSIGKNTVDGPGAMALMMWEDNASATGFADRNALLAEVLAAILEQLTTLTEAEFTSFYDKICEEGLIKTTFTPKDLVSQIQLIYAVNDERFTEKVLEYPGRYAAPTETSDAYFVPDTSAGVIQFKNYRKIFESDN